jgi:hypothetical protein
MAYAQPACTLTGNPLVVPYSGGTLTFGISCTNLTPFTQYYQVTSLFGKPLAAGNGQLGVSDANGRIDAPAFDSYAFAPNPSSTPSLEIFNTQVCHNPVCIQDNVVATTNSVKVVQAGAPPSIVYTVDVPGALIGTITTDGTIGSLGGGNIVAWNLTATVANPAGGPPLTFYFNSATPSTGAEVRCGPAGCGLASAHTLSFPGAAKLDLGLINSLQYLSFNSNNVTVYSPLIGGAEGRPVTGPVTLGNQPSPDLNQHGLTGSWYQPATSGQGLEVEIFPNPAGTGSAFVSWFTFATAAGGASAQRWYTVQGPVATGQPNASLTIYENTDGNFNAPPPTTANAVGTLILNFFTCTDGHVSYSFNDGRTGNIALTRLLPNVTCSTTMPYATNADYALSGNWFDSTLPGQGFTIEVNPLASYLFVAWYTYEPGGSGAGAAGQRWYTAQAGFTAGMRSIPVTIYETTGGIFNTPPPAPQTVPVGTGTLAFQSCTAATLSYNFSGGTSAGLSGIITLSRVGPVPPGCTS